MFLHRSLRQKKNVLARARQVAPQSYATLASTAVTRLAALLSLRYRYVWCSLRACQLVFSSKRSLSRHPRLLLPPNPLRFRYRSILLHWVQPPLIVRLACGSRGRRAVIVFALLRFVSFAPALISQVWQHSLLSCLISLSSHISSTQRRACLSLITLRSAHSVTLH